MNPYAIDAQGNVIKLMWSYKYSFNGPRTVVKIISDGRKSDADFFFCVSLDSGVAFENAI